MTDPGRLAGKAAVVTGGTKESGRAIAERLAAEGSAVAVLGRSVDAGGAVAQSLRDSGASAVFVAVDLSNEQSVRLAVSEVSRTFGHIDIVVNHAAATDTLRGSGEFPAIDEPSETFDRMMKTNVYGPFWMAKYGLPHMLGNGGSIINVSSINAIRPGPGMPGYAASKAALEGLTRQLATDYGPHGVRVNAISLGAMLHSETRELFADPASASNPDLRMVRRIGVPADLAAMVAFLASDESAFVTGAVLALDGGAAAKFPRGAITTS